MCLRSGGERLVCCELWTLFSGCPGTESQFHYEPYWETYISVSWESHRSKTSPQSINECLNLQMVTSKTKREAVFCLLVSQISLYVSVCVVTSIISGDTKQQRCSWNPPWKQKYILHSLQSPTSCLAFLFLLNPFSATGVTVALTKSLSW